MKSLDADEFVAKLDRVLDRFPDEFKKCKKHITPNEQAGLFRFGGLISSIRDCRPQLKELFHQSALWTRRNGYSLHEPIAHGIGQYGLFYKINPHIRYRFEADKVLRIQHDLMLPNHKMLFDQPNRLTVEIVPLVDTSRVTKPDLEIMRDQVSADNRVYISDTHHIGNLGYYKNKLLMLDPGSLKWKTGFSPTTFPT